MSKTKVVAPSEVELLAIPVSFVADLQQRLALKDREIMRLRGYLNIVIPALVKQGVKITVEGVPMEQILSTPTTYDDLMAWHNEQMGEPVAYMLIEDGFPMFYKNKSPEATFSDKFWEMYRREIKPLYANKG